MKLRFRRLLRFGLILVSAGILLASMTVAALLWMILPQLPDVDVLRHVELQVPLSVRSFDGELIAVFGEARRDPIRIAQVPDHVRQAFIAIEDARFYEHPGVDWRGVSRAIWLLATTSDERVPGGSTITQQVARQFFLSNEVSYTRKLSEMLLALKMERELSKDEILELYLNKSFFGNRAYGVAAAADFYYGKKLDRISLDEAAMLAALPKFPSSGNPIVNPDRALERRDYVLQRMAELGFISAQEMTAAQAVPNHASPHEPPIELDAPYIAEMVRKSMGDRFGDAAMTSGFDVRSTVDSRLQRIAQDALRDNLVNYDRRHGWRGPAAHVDLPEDGTAPDAQSLLRDYRPIGNLVAALVTEVDAKHAKVVLRSGLAAELKIEDAAKWAAEFRSVNSRGARPNRMTMLVKPGDIVRVGVKRDESGGLELSQVPDVQGALVALRPEDGRVIALTGGFDFYWNKFNRATQAERQPGSSFKPFVYAAAFERGFTPASIVLDAPVQFRDRWTGKVWSPQNSDGKFRGPMRLREAMVSSRNLVSVRLLDAVGVKFAREYIEGFGFPIDALPPNLSMALGTTSVPPLTVAQGYAVIANGGYLVDPYFIDEVRNRNGTVIIKAHPARACAHCPERAERDALRGEAEAEGFDLSDAGEGRALAVAEQATRMGPDPLHLAEHTIDTRNTYLVRSLLRDVVDRGTGKAAKALERPDIGGKTGTTNDYRDAWFSGFGTDLVVTAWVGRDDFRSLGRSEYGGTTALPMWMTFVAAALEGVEPLEDELPEGLATAQIDPGSGLRVGSGGKTEYFRAEDVSRVENQSSTWEYRANAEEEFEIF